MTDLSFCLGLLKKGKDPVCWQPVSPSMLPWPGKTQRTLTAASAIPALVSPEALLGLGSQAMLITQCLCTLPPGASLQPEPCDDSLEWDPESSP